MPKAAKLKAPMNVRQCTVSMRAPVVIEVGSILRLPYSAEVAAGEPSYWKTVHARYNNENCEVVGIVVRNQVRGKQPSSDDVTLTVEFDNSYQVDAIPDAFVYVSPPKRK